MYDLIKSLLAVHSGEAGCLFVTKHPLKCNKYFNQQFCVGFLDEITYLLKYIFNFIIKNFL